MVVFPLTEPASIVMMTTLSTMHHPRQMALAVPKMAVQYAATGKTVDVAAPLVSVEVARAIVAMAASPGLACLAFKLLMVLVDLKTVTRSVVHSLVALVAPRGGSVVETTVIAVRV